MNARGHLSSETIDLLLMAALNTEQESSARAHLGECTFCQQRWDELNEDKARFEQYVFPRTVERLEQRIASPSLAERFFGGWKMWVPLMAASAVAVAYVGSRPRPDDPYLGIKGGASLEVVAQRGDNEQFAVTPGTVLHPKDKIRFVVNPAGSRHVLIASRDAAGAFTVYFPYGATQSSPIQGAHVTLPGSIELDDVVGTERLVAVFSEAPVRSDAVKNALEANAKDPKVENAKVVTWEFVKAR